MLNSSKEKIIVHNYNTIISCIVPLRFSKNWHLIRVYTCNEKIASVLFHETSSHHISGGSDPKSAQIRLFAPLLKCACSKPRNFLLVERVGVIMWPGACFNPFWKAQVKIGGLLAVGTFFCFPPLPKKEQYIFHPLFWSNSLKIIFFKGSEPMSVRNHYFIFTSITGGKASSWRNAELQVDIFVKKHRSRIWPTRLCCRSSRLRDTSIENKQM
jgi:hypothetical protein